MHGLPPAPHPASKEEGEEEEAFFSSQVSTTGEDGLLWFSQGTGHKEEALAAKDVTFLELSDKAQSVFYSNVYFISTSGYAEVGWLCCKPCGLVLFRFCL